MEQQQQQLLNMGFPQDLASQALAATGGKSTLKATEWILAHRSPDSEKTPPPPSNTNSNTNTTSKLQARVDRFFPTSSPASKDASDASASLHKIAHNKPDASLSLHKIAHNKLDPSPSLHKIAHDPPTKPVDDALKCNISHDPDFADSRLFTSLPSSSIEPSSKRQRVEDQPKEPLASRKSSKVPLAERMRPLTIDEIVGQDHLLGPASILRSLLQNDTVPSVIFWGPPGTGKTSLARAISRAVSYRFVTASAVTSGVKEVREILEEGKRLMKMGQRTLFFVDEVHRFNKAQQDAFLPAIEAGHVVFIGATTENPSFEVNSALLSRCRVLTLNKLQPESIRKLLGRALSDVERGVMASFVDDSFVKRITADDEALQFLSSAADGDARVALNALEVAVAAAASREKQRGGKPVQDGTHLAAEKKVETADVTKENASLSPKEWTRSSLNVVSVKRDFPMTLSALKESLHPSQNEYKRPFKKFEGGRQVTSYSSSKGLGTAFEAGDELVGAKALEGTRTFIESAPADMGPVSSYASADLRDVGENIRGTGVASVCPEEGEIVVRLVDVSEALQRSHLVYDKTGEEHYNLISALHKSMRGGDPDAAVYWLARMMEGGEGPLYIARRLVRFASEDIGLADPQALTLAVACYQACHFLGMPECNVHLAQCVVYLSLAPKSVSVYQAIEAAQKVVRETGQNEPVPLHLRNAPTGLMKQLGYGKGYIYPPYYEGQVKQEYLPPSLRGHKFLKGT